MIPSRERFVRPKRVVAVRQLPTLSSQPPKRSSTSSTAMTKTHTPRSSADYALKAKHGYLVPSTTVVRRPTSTTTSTRGFTNKSNNTFMGDQGIRIKAGRSTPSTTTKRHGVQHPGGGYQLKGQNGCLVRSR